MVKYSQDPLSAVFGALSDPTRRAILERLARGEFTVSELAEPFDMSLPAVSKHLKVLEEAGLLHRLRDGRLRRCRLDPAPLGAASNWIESHRAFWDAQFQRLERYLEETEGTTPRQETFHGPGNEET